MENPDSGFMIQGIRGQGKSYSQDIIYGQYKYCETCDIEFDTPEEGFEHHLTEHSVMDLWASERHENMFRKIKLEKKNVKTN